MQPNQHIVATITRIEVEPSTDRVFAVFEIIDEKLKKEIRASWVEDIEFKIMGRDLIQEEND